MKNQNISIFILILFFQVSTHMIYAQTGNETQGQGSGTNILTGDFNTMYGDSSGHNLSSTSNTVLIGYRAGIGITSSAHGSVFIGYDAGYSNTSGFDNVFIGEEAGRLNTTGGDNTFIGTEAGENNTTGGDNVFIGEEAGTSNETGSDNVFIGEDAGFLNTTGEDNCFVGSNAGLSNVTGSGNTFVGGASSSTLVDNTISGILGFQYSFYTVGGGSGYDNKGHANTFIGSGAGTDNGEGLANTMVGYGAGANNEHADGNTFVGYAAGWDNNRTNALNNADRNTYLGALAGGTNRVGSDNVFIGWDADFNGAGTSGNNQNVVIGASAKMSVNNLNNAVSIGYQSSVSSSNTISIGNATSSTIGGSVNWTATSDGRFKTSVQENVIGLEFIDRLRPVTYHYDVEKLHTSRGFSPDELAAAIKEKEQIRYSGFIAQEVEQAAEAIGYDFSGVDVPQNDQEVYGLRYAEFTVPMVKAMQELHEKVKAQEIIIIQQQEELQSYRNMFSQLESRIDKIEGPNKVKTSIATIITPNSRE